MVKNLREIQKDWPIPAWPSRDALLSFVRYWAPDLQIRTARLDGGLRACGARFTLRGKVVEVEAVEDGKIDVDDAIVRRVAWHIYRALGFPQQVDNAKSVRLEREVIAASLSGDDALRDRLAQELAVHNDRRTGFRAIGSRFGT